MADLSEDRIRELLRPYLPHCSGDILAKLKAYLDLLMKWNERINLTAVRDANDIVRRHFGESLFAGLHVVGVETLLDYGSGAGFPGIPIALLHPEIRVTLAESQGKKATFLREVVRVLDISVEVWGGRVEAMAAGKNFDCVTLRSVDRMPEAVADAWRLSRREILLLTTSSVEAGLMIPMDFELAQRVRLPESAERLFLRYVRDVPRGTSSH